MNIVAESVSMSCHDAIIFDISVAESQNHQMSEKGMAFKHDVNHFSKNTN